MRAWLPGVDGDLWPLGAVLDRAVAAMGDPVGRLVASRARRLSLRHTARALVGGFEVSRYRSSADRSPTVSTTPAEQASAITAALACGSPSCKCRFAARNGRGNTHCPLHDDVRPSLTINGADLLLWHCKAGCSQDAVQVALTERGLLHRIRDRNGAVVAYHERKGPWAGPDGTVGLNGASPKNMLYGLEKLADHDNASVLVTEGEKAADAAQRLLGDDWVVLGTFGTGIMPSTAVLGNLRGRRVWLWPDADDPGRKHMDNVAAILVTIAAEVRLIEWADAPPKGDAVDWHGSTTELDELIEAARPLQTTPPVNVVRGYTIAEARAELDAEPLDSLPLLGYEGYIVRGWTHLLAGWWRLGKTETLTQAIVPWLRQGIDVLWISEEPHGVWPGRADKLGDIYGEIPWEERLTLLDARRYQPAELLDFAAGHPAPLVIVDTVQECCGIAAIRDDEAVRDAVNPWVRRLLGRTVIFLHQHRKQEGESGSRVSGSVALPAMMDVVLELKKHDDEDEDDDPRRRLTCRRRGEPTPTLHLVKQDDGRIEVVPDGRQRSRVETENAVVEVVSSAGKPLTTVEVMSRMSLAPSRDTVTRALTAAAEARRIQRDPPITEPAERRTVTWFSAALQQNLPQELHSLSVEFSAADDVAADYEGNEPPVPAPRVPAPRPRKPCPECASLSWFNLESGWACANGHPWRAAHRVRTGRGKR
jgi:DNA repair protein RadA/Sms